jgi:gluconolactonase
MNTIHRHLLIVAVASGLFASSAFVTVDADDLSKVVKPGATLKLVFSDGKFTEGPAADREGNVYFTDQPNDRIVKIGIDGKVSDFMKPAGRSNGMFFTDPFYKRPWWSHNDRPQDVQAIYRVSEDRSRMVRQEEAFKQPNGIVGDAKRSLLFVADIGDGVYTLEMQTRGISDQR